MVLDYFKSKNEFNDSIRTMIVDLIINNILTKKSSVAVNLAENIATQTQSLFPTEVQVT